MPVLGASFTEAELQVFAYAVASIAFWSGVGGAVCWSVVARLLSMLVDALCEFEEKQRRISAARARSALRRMHGSGLRG